MVPSNPRSSECSTIMKLLRVVLVLHTWLQCQRMVSAFTPSHVPGGGPQIHPINPVRVSPIIEPELFQGSLPSSFRQQRSRTARESAVLVEWERLSELERRIEDGFRYMHDPEAFSSSVFATHRTNPNCAARSGSGNAHMEDNALPGVFCGYRVMPEEYNRLRSADPRDSSHY